MAILIKRYANRKLYNTESSRYITLKGIAKLLEDGEEVRVIDNETGDDITRVALSQILVDNQRAHESPSDTLLSQILSKGGDALYGAIKKSVDDATDGLGEFQDRFRKIVNQADPAFRWDRRTGAPSFQEDSRSQEDGRSQEDSRSQRDDRSEASSDSRNRAMTNGWRQEAAANEHLDRVIRSTLVEVLDSFDLPRRRDFEGIAKNLERVAEALERLESKP